MARGFPVTVWKQQLTLQIETTCVLLSFVYCSPGALAIPFPLSLSVLCRAVPIRGPGGWVMQLVLSPSWGSFAYRHVRRNKQAKGVYNRSWQRTEKMLKPTLNE